MNTGTKYDSKSWELGEQAEKNQPWWPEMESKDIMYYFSKDSWYYF